MPRTMPPLARLAGSLLLSLNLSAADWTISTLAGTGQPGHRGEGGPAAQAEVADPFGVVRGPDGAIWFCEYTTGRIRRITPDGRLTTFAGAKGPGYGGDGASAEFAQFKLPAELRFDAAGNLFVADMGNHAIRRIDARTRVVTTIAGTPGQRGYAGDGGPATAALLNSPHSIQFDRHGDLYLCDVSNHVIRRVDARTGGISTFAGTGKPGPTPDGAPIAGTPLNNPRAIEFDRDGNLWLATREGNQVFKLDLVTGLIHHVAGNGATGFTGHGGPAREAALSGPKGLAIDAAGNAWLADTESHSVRMIDAQTGRLELIAGTGKKGDGPDGDPLACAMNRLHGIFVDADGSILIGDSEAHRVRRLHRR